MKMKLRLPESAKTAPQAGTHCGVSDWTERYSVLNPKLETAIEKWKQSAPALDPSDERQGLPSASQIERMSLCSPSFHMEKQAPASGAATPDADKGDAIHEYLCSKVGDFVTLSRTELETAERCREIVNKLRRGLGINSANEGLWTELRESRIWLKDHGTNKNRLSGKADYITYNPAARYALIVDYKTGHIPSEHASSNMQLRTLAVLLQRAHGNLFDNIKVVIVQPNCSPAYTECVYGRDDLQKAYLHILTVLTHSEMVRGVVMKNNFNPSEKACRYCKAKTICRAAIQNVEDLAKIDPAKVMTFHTDHYPALIKKIRWAEKVIDALKDAVVDMIAKHNNVPKNGRDYDWTNFDFQNQKPPFEGVKMERGSNSREIDIDKAWNTLSTVLTPAEFISTTKVQSTKLKDALGKATGLKGSKLNDTFDSLLASASTFKQKKPSLVIES